MQEYMVEVRLVASARVRAGSEGLAFEVVFSAIRSPGPGEIELANEAGFFAGKKAKIVSVDTRTQSSSLKSTESRSDARTFPGDLPVLPTGVQGPQSSALYRIA